jgi:hypothetical protein
MPWGSPMSMTPLSIAAESPVKEPHPEETTTSSMAADFGAHRECGGGTSSALAGGGMEQLHQRPIIRAFCIIIIATYMISLE